jgi:hypothetical protein
VNQVKQGLTGRACAIVFSSWCALYTLIGLQWWSVIQPLEANRVFAQMGKWVPYGWAIGPYAGKEVITLIVWVVAQGILTLLLKKRTFSVAVLLRSSIYLFMGFLLLLWPPFYHMLWGWLPNIP